MHVIGKLLELILGNNVPSRYEDPKNPTVVVYIGGITPLNNLIDLRETMNTITKEIVELHGLTNIRSTPTLLELVDGFRIQPEGILEDIIILVDSLYYRVYFTFLYPKTCLRGHILILGIQWMATRDTFIICLPRWMKIYNGHTTKDLVLYPPVKPSSKFEYTSWSEYELE